jgi:hypothetical protein
MTPARPDCQLVVRSSLVEDPPAPLTPSTRRSTGSPEAGRVSKITSGHDRWHGQRPCRQLCSSQSSREVPADTAGARRHRHRHGGWERSGRIGVRAPETPGMVAGNRGVGSGRWRCRSGRGRPPPATRRHLRSGPLRHGGAGLALRVPGTLIGRPPKPVAAGGLPSGRGPLPSPCRALEVACAPGGRRPGPAGPGH